MEQMSIFDALASPGRDDALRLSQLAADTRWNEQEQARVDRAIARCAWALPDFTADDVWAELADAVPVTKGLSARLMVAARRGVIEATGTVRPSTRTTRDPRDAGRALKVWRGVPQ